MNDDETVISLLPEGLRELYGRGFDDVSDEYSDLVSYVHRPVVRAGKLPPIALAFEIFDEKDVPLAFVVGDKIIVHGVKVRVADYEMDTHPGFGSRGPVNVWTVYVDEVGDV